MMAQQARDTSLITDRRQAHDHQVSSLFFATTRHNCPERLICRALFIPNAEAARDRGSNDPPATGHQMARVHGPQPHPVTCGELATRDANRTSYPSARTLPPICAFRDRVATGASRAGWVAICGHRMAAVQSVVLTVAGPVVNSAAVV
jgi:hypothetical protein